MLNKNKKLQEKKDGLTESSHWILFYAIVGSLSMFSSLMVALTIYCNKKLKEHPNMLICYISIANFISGGALLVYIIRTPDMVCYFGLAGLHQWTVELLLRG